MDSSDFSYPAVNLSIYKPNFTGECLLSFFDLNKEHYGERVHIVDVDQ